MEAVFCVILSDLEWDGETGLMKCSNTLLFIRALIEIMNGAFRHSKHTNLVSS